MTAIVLPADETRKLPAKQGPELPAEETTVVEQFIENSKDIVPGIQVSLARRVVMPGSKKVLCMAAHTSVPMNEDEVSSVSQLALRLSDGTSCLLSLQFFNDTTGGEYVPPTYNNFVYDPERYNTVQGQSNLGIFLVATALCAIVCFYHAIKNNPSAPLQPHQQIQQWKPPAKSTVSASKAAAPKAATKPENKTALKPEQNKATATKHLGRIGSAPKVSHALGGQHLRASQSYRGGQEGYLVPPPPPMVYSWPTNARQFGFPLPEQLPGQSQPVTATLAKAAPVAKSVNANLAHATAPQKAAIPSATNKTISEDKPVQEIVIPAPASSRLVMPINNGERSAVMLKSGQSAPAPGSDSVPLERIVLPNQ